MASGTVVPNRLFFMKLERFYDERCWGAVLPGFTFHIQEIVGTQWRKIFEWVSTSKSESLILCYGDDDLVTASKIRGFKSFIEVQLSDSKW